jgi:hypothetical protein
VVEEGIFYKVQLFLRNGRISLGESGRKGAAAAGKKGQERRRQVAGKKMGTRGGKGDVGRGKEKG